MKKSFTKVLMLALAVISMGVLGSCKDYEEDKYNDLQHQIADQNKTLTDALAEQKAYLEGLIAKIKQCDCDKSVVEKAVKDIEDLQARMKAAEENISSVQEAVNIIVGEIVDINKLLIKLGTDLEAQGVKIDELREEMLGKIQLWSDKVLEVEQTAAQALSQAQANAEAIGIINGQIVDINNELSDKATKDEMLAVLATAEALYLDALNYADALAEGLAEDIANNQAAIAALEGAMDQMGVDINNLYFSTDLLWTISDILAQEISDIQDQVDANTENIFNVAWAVSDLERLVEINTQWLNDLQTSLDALMEDVYGKMVTGVIVQGTYNPAFGKLNLPAGINSNMLIAYYGTVDADVDFPCKGVAYVDNFVYRSDAITDADLAILKQKGASTHIFSGKLVSKAADNAGKMYVTINPNTVDFTGKTVQLVNSMDQVAPVTLAPLAQCEDTLTFGYSRAANGLYTVKAKIAADDVEKLDYINNKNWESLVQEAYQTAKRGDESSALNIVLHGLYDQLNSNMPALAVKASWKDANNVEHNVYSNYGVGAATIKPLSFETLQDLNIQNLPGYNKVKNAANTIISTIINKINGALSSLNINPVSPIAIGSISTPTVGVIEVTLDLPVYSISTPGAYNMDDMGLHYTDLNTGADVLVWAGNITLDANGNVVIRLDVADVDINPQVAQIFAAINAALANTNADLATVVNEINAMIAEVNNLQGNFSAAGNSIKNELIAILDKFNNKAVYWLNHTNKALQPLLFVNDPKLGAHICSRLETIPTVTSADVTLIPTSYSAELIAPAYKKEIACTKAWNVADNSENTAARDAINNMPNMCELLDGGNEIQFSVAFQPGVKYELTYAAVDYFGKISVRKSYVVCE